MIPRSRLRKYYCQCTARTLGGKLGMLRRPCVQGSAASSKLRANLCCRYFTGHMTHHNPMFSYDHPFRTVKMVHSRSFVLRHGGFWKESAAGVLISASDALVLQTHTAVQQRPEAWSRNTEKAVGLLGRKLRNIVGTGLSKLKFMPFQLSLHGLSNSIEVEDCSRKNVHIALPYWAHTHIYILIYKYFHACM